MATIAEHRDVVAALVGPLLASLATAPDGLEERLVDDLVRATGAGQGHRVLGEQVTTAVDLPPFDNSQMDGYAVRAADAGASVDVVAPIPAGVVPPPLAAGEAAPIMTGSRMPDGADAVVPVEEVPPGSFPAGLALPTLTVPPVRVGTFVRPRGSDLPAGGVLAPAGALVTPAVLGVLAAAGVTSVRLVRPLRVLVVSTGSELGAAAPAGASRLGASIGDANGTSLRAALAEVGVESRAVRVSDDPALFLEAVTGAVGDWADLVLTTGGISMGAYEVVREVLEPRGLVVTTVAMQPGGPQASGTVSFGGRALPVLAFPGNPVSALVSFEVFLRPLLAPLVGLPSAREASVLPATTGAPSPAGKHQIRRGTVVDGRVAFVGGASSHLLAHYADATHLVHVPVGVASVEPGDPLEVWRIR